ncbi:unnamed protein product, partial [Gulo gulo]
RAARAPARPRSVPRSGAGPARSPSGRGGGSGNPPLGPAPCGPPGAERRGRGKLGRRPEPPRPRRRLPGRGRAPLPPTPAGRPTGSDSGSEGVCVFWNKAVGIREDHRPKRTRTGKCQSQALVDAPCFAKEFL